MIEIFCIAYPGLVDEAFLEFMTAQLNDGREHRMVRWLETEPKHKLVYYLHNEDIAKNIKAITNWCNNNMRNIEKVHIGYGDNGQFFTRN